MKHSLCLILFVGFFISCESGFDKSLISEVYKLPSTSGKFTLHRYFIESPMAFGSGFTVINIVKSDLVSDYSDRDILRFPGAYPFYVKWKDDKTLFVRCTISESGMAKQQPFKKEVIRWKDWTINVEYYGIYSSGVGQRLVFSDYSLNGKWITFRSGNDSLRFDRDSVQFSIRDRKVYVDEFYVESFNNKLGLSFKEHELNAIKGVNLLTLKSEQPFLISDLHR